MIDVAAADVNAQKTVVFVPQDFATVNRCEDLMGRTESVKYVPIPKESSPSDIMTMIADPRYDGYKKVLITTTDMDSKTLKLLAASNEGAFKDILPLNVDSDDLDTLSTAEAKVFQKATLMIGLLGSALPKHQDKYKMSKTYMVLKAMLKLVFDDDKVIEDYIACIANPDQKMSPSTRFGLLLDRIIGPMEKLVTNVVMEIVKIFA
jgi:hypothetical protein